MYFKSLRGLVPNTRYVLCSVNKARRLILEIMCRVPQVTGRIPYFIYHVFQVPGLKLKIMNHAVKVMGIISDNKCMHTIPYDTELINVLCSLSLGLQT